MFPPPFVPGTSLALGNVCVSENGLAIILLQTCSLKGASPVRSTLGCQRERAETDASCLANFVVLISTTTVIFFKWLAGIKQDRNIAPKLLNIKESSVLVADTMRPPCSSVSLSPPYVEA